MYGSLSDADPPAGVDAETTDALQRLLDSAQTVAAKHGLEGLTVQAAAAEAGISLTTATAYFGSDDHLISEVLWRYLTAAPTSPTTRGPLPSKRRRTRIAVTDMLQLRAKTHYTVRARVRAALGPHPDPDTAATLEALYMGTLLTAVFGVADQSPGMRSPEQIVKRIVNRR